jgi:hypothetical protein
MSDRHISNELRRLVADRAGHCCEYCLAQDQFSSDSFTIDHFIPQSLNGPTAADNLAYSCHGCNHRKSARISFTDSVTGEKVPFFNPRFQVWEDHFAWDESFTLIFGLTSVGRATIAALGLNRSGLVNLRRALYAIGEHPPRNLDRL